ncbi:MAG: ATP-binding protein [Fibrobacter sp.]|nr:ATP-binding protein [Fibrobacter sp.]
MNPFFTTGYHGADYFCDRVDETKKMTRLLTNGNNVALISPRRMGKTGLIRHCFAQPSITQKYYTFVVDIYATKCLEDFVYEVGRQILSVLKPRGKKAIEKFIDVVKSLRPGISFDIQGIPTWNMELGSIQNSNTTLDEIFSYLENAGKPCLVAIDEFQSISNYPEKNIEAKLRTYIQRCNNVHFIFSGSARSMMSEIFTSAARPFYQSVSIMNLGPILESNYFNFINHHFERNNRKIADAAIQNVYRQFEGITWYIQKVMNHTYSLIEKGGECEEPQIEQVISDIVQENSDSYNSMLYLLTPAQKALLVAIGKEGKAQKITGQQFMKKHSLASASSVQKAALALQEKQMITVENGVYQVYDKFMSIWLRQ